MPLLATRAPKSSREGIRQLYPNPPHVGYHTCFPNYRFVGNTNQRLLTQPCSALPSAPPWGGSAGTGPRAALALQSSSRPLPPRWPVLPEHGVSDGPTNDAFHLPSPSSGDLTGKTGRHLLYSSSTQQMGFVVNAEALHLLSNCSVT